jgi:hypothetical protein
MLAMQEPAVPAERRLRCLVPRESGSRRQWRFRPRVPCSSDQRLIFYKRAAHNCVDIHRRSDHHHHHHRHHRYHHHCNEYSGFSDVRGSISGGIAQRHMQMQTGLPALPLARWLRHWSVSSHARTRTCKGGKKEKGKRKEKEKKRREKSRGGMCALG